jgi:hypothetical protein
MRCVEGAVVTRMLADLPGETDRVLMDRFGISYNTWRKVRAGEPVRSSVADRLEQRVSG